MDFYGLLERPVDFHELHEIINRSVVFSISLKLDFPKCLIWTLIKFCIVDFCKNKPFWLRTWSLVTVVKVNSIHVVSYFFSGCLGSRCLETWEPGWTSSGSAVPHACGGKNKIQFTARNFQHYYSNIYKVTIKVPYSQLLLWIVKIKPLVFKPRLVTCCQNKAPTYLSQHPHENLIFQIHLKGWLHHFSNVEACAQQSLELCDFYTTLRERVYGTYLCPTFTSILITFL